MQKKSLPRFGFLLFGYHPLHFFPHLIDGTGMYFRFRFQYHPYSPIHLFGSPFYDVILSEAKDLYTHTDYGWIPKSHRADGSPK